MFIVRWLYTVLCCFILPFAFIRLWWRGRCAPGYRQHWAERLGFINTQQQRPIWFHAVSLGETRAALPLIKAVMAQTQAPILVTNMTPTGREAVQQALGDTVSNFYIPYDIPLFIAIFLKRVNPRACVILETEIWPNLFVSLKRHNIPTIIANARLSPRSYRRYMTFRCLMRNILAHVHVAAQSPMDAERYTHIGAQTVQSLGNIKYDMACPEGLQDKVSALKAQLGERPIWVAASTHDGEEDKILDAHHAILAQVPNAALILVPRHPERFSAVAALCSEKGFKVTKRSTHESLPAHHAVFLGDTMGEMLTFMGAADAAFVGGSFVPIGGHNTLEAALLKRPVCVGPHTFNFVDITHQLSEAGGLERLEGLHELVYHISNWLKSPALAAQVGAKGHAVVTQNRGAVQRLTALLQDLMAQAND